MNIGNRTITTSSPIYIIAEIGVNHDGSADRAIELIHAAARAGADAVKFQVFEADCLLSRASRLADYQEAAGESDAADMLRRLELPFDALARAVRTAHATGIAVIATMFHVEHCSALAELPWDAFKSASPDIIHRPLLHAMAHTGRPLIISTGASTIDEITRAAAWLDDRRAQLAFLQCVSSYPAPQAALGGIAAIARATALPTGYSDHTPHIETGAAAVRAGAIILERHLTYDRAARGPDHAASLDPAGFAEYVRLAREAEHGSERHVEPAQKLVLPCEREVREVSRQSVVARRPIGPNAIIAQADLTFKRPGAGIEPWRIEEIIGRRAVRAIEADTPIVWEDVA